MQTDNQTMTTTEGCFDQDEAARELGVLVVHVTALVLTGRLDQCPSRMHARPRCNYVTRESLMRHKAWRAASPWWHRTLKRTKTFLKELANGF